MVVNIKRLKGAITIFLSFLDELDKFVTNDMQNATISQIRLRRDDLVSKHTQFLEYQTTLEIEDECELESTTRTDVNLHYYKLRPMLEDRMEELKGISKGTSVKPIDDLGYLPKLPELTFDTFYGEPTKFRSFIESFDTHIHRNPRLNDFIKFQYLKSCCKGPGAKPFENLEFLAANYEHARELLFERFNRTNRILEEHVNSLFKIKPIERPNSQKLLELLDEFNSHLRSLKTLGRPTEYWDDLIIYLVVSKFDSETRLRWREEISLNSIPTFEDISKFIKKRSYKLDGQARPITYQQQVNKVSIASKGPYVRPRQTLHATKSYSCVNCKQTNHSIMRCYQFLGLSTNDRLKRVEELKLCLNCLRTDHCIDNCTVVDRCRSCDGKHHSLLHHASRHSNTTAIQSVQTSNLLAVSSQSVPERNLSTSLTSSIGSRSVFLATALVEISDADNRIIVARAILDSGSMLNFITKSLASKLRLKATKSPAQIRGIGGSPIMGCNSASVEFRSRVSQYSASMEVHIIPKISEYEPNAIQLDPSKWSIPSNIKLADPKFFSPKEIDLLIGAELFFELQAVGQIKLGDNLPILQNTRLGWVVSGRATSFSTDDQFCNLAVTNSPPTSLDALMERFWTIEERDSSVKVLTLDNGCEKHFVENYTKNTDGRFVVRLPFFRPVSELGNSSVIARRRFLNLERRLNRQPNLQESYNAFMREYISLNHMQSVNSVEANHFYLPHHCVLKPDSTSTKLRVVFDGSAKTTSGVSLNEILMAGPVVQNELFIILLRFRAHAYAISADVAKMYRQVIIHPEDRKFQYIYWRFDAKDPLLTYQLNTVTYGTTPASFLATRCIFQIALDYETESPLASTIIRRDMYVDDLLSGANSREDIIDIKVKVSSILQSAGMSLRKWCSNDSNFLADIPDDDREQLLQINDDEFIKTLGLYWHSHSDTFRINVNIVEQPPRITKRTVVSEIAKIFDPIGLISPVVVLGKMFMQQLWQLKLNWDESLPLSG